MEALSGDQIAERLESLIHHDTQVQEDRVDLTASSVFNLKTPGKLDFGGGEFQPAKREVLSPVKEHSEDDYGWWKLEEGTYLVEFNEKIRLNGNGLPLIFSHPHLIESAAQLESTIAPASEKPIVVPLHVGNNRCHIKENARIATLKIFR